LEGIRWEDETFETEERVNEGEFTQETESEINGNENGEDDEDEDEFATNFEI
jgi:hypothetical protein